MKSFITLAPDVRNVKYLNILENDASFELISENKSDIILVKSLNSLDWLHTLNLAFNYLLINSVNYF
jgi:hypothetical protein